MVRPAGLGRSAQGEGRACLGMQDPKEPEVALDLLALLVRLVYLDLL